MAISRSFQSDYYRIPLEVTLTDSMHGDMPDFELNTVRIKDEDGYEGVGYTFTAGHNGVGIGAILEN